MEAKMNNATQESPRPSTTLAQKISLGLQGFAQRQVEIARETRNMEFQDPFVRGAAGVMLAAADIYHRVHDPAPTTLHS
jgi:hypothetical protein